MKDETQSKEHTYGLIFFSTGHPFTLYYLISLSVLPCILFVCELGPCYTMTKTNPSEIVANYNNKYRFSMGHRQYAIKELKPDKSSSITVQH